MDQEICCDGCGKAFPLSELKIEIGPKGYAYKKFVCKECLKENEGRVKDHRSLIQGI